MKRNSEPTQSFSLPDIGIPAELLFNPEISHTEKILFGFIRNLSQREQGCTASNRWLGGLIDVGPQTVSNSVAKLKDWYYINVYYHTKPDGMQTRRIFVNPKFPELYRQLVIEGHKNLNMGVLKNIYPSIEKLIGGYKELNTKADRENDREDDREADARITSASKNGFLTKSMFEKFWKIYPRKVNKGQAKTAFEKICNKPSKDKPTWKQVAKAIIQQSKSERWQDKKYIPHPTTWLNQQRWLDDPADLTVPYQNKDRANKAPSPTYIPGKYDNVPVIYDD